MFIIIIELNALKITSRFEISAKLLYHNQSGVFSPRVLLRAPKTKILGRNLFRKECVLVFTLVVSFGQATCLSYVCSKFEESLTIIIAITRARIYIGYINKLCKLNLKTNQSVTEIGAHKLFGRYLSPDLHEALQKHQRLRNPSRLANT